MSIAPRDPPPSQVLRAWAREGAPAVADIVLAGPAGEIVLDASQL
jgi:hypothetical protein